MTPRIPVEKLALVAVVVVTLVNAWLVAPLLVRIVTDTQPAFDYNVLSTVPSLENPYDQPWYVWSPVAVYPLHLLTIIGEVGWRLLHVVALTPLGWPLGVVVGLSWPFWYDVVGGNLVTFITVVGWLALRGSRPAAVGFFVLAVLIPRPMMVPLVAWMLWREPWSRRWFAGIFAAHALLVLASGYGPDWIDRLLHLPGIMENPGNLVGWLGWWWTPIGVIVALLAFGRGRLGVASLAIQPYIWPPYLLVLAWELRSEVLSGKPHRRNAAGQRPVGARVVVHHDLPVVGRH